MKNDKVKFEKEITQMAKNINLATDERILKLYNETINEKAKELTEVEFSLMCGVVSMIISKKTKGKRDAIAEFVLKNKHIEGVIIKEKGYFYLMFVCLMCKLGKI